jgi:hypothetical protein
MKELKIMALEEPKNCPCFQTKIESGPLDLVFFYYGGKLFLQLK